MSEMVERVARAISSQEGNDWDGQLGGRECVRIRYRNMARAAIEAMREPTREMINIISKTYFEIESVELDDQASAKQNAVKLVTYIARGWHAMIDEALK